MYDYMHQAMLDRITEIGKQRQRIDSLYFWGREFVKRAEAPFNPFFISFPL